MTKKRALISVYDKTGAPELAAGLYELGWEIVSTSTTADRIREAGVPVTDVAKVTGSPEMLGGRVKTLHPKIHGGILADLDKPQHVADLAARQIEPIDLVVCNLYPFASDPSIELIDVGGPTMVRGAAKNHAHIGVVVDPADYELVLTELREHNGELPDETRLTLAKKAFDHTAAYDAAIANWFHRDELFPNTLHLTLIAVPGDELRYGENPHQPAMRYRNPRVNGGLSHAVQLHGKGMSRNNFLDANAALRAVSLFDEEPCVAIVKHENPCGVAVGADVAEAHRKAHGCDSTSAFGGVIAANCPISVEMTEQIADIFTEVIVASSYEDGALEILKKKRDLRVLQVEASSGQFVEFEQIDGGWLAQTVDLVRESGDFAANWVRKCGDPVDEDMLRDLQFAWRACRSVKSNAILLASGGASVGIGMGQVSRVEAAELAVKRAGTRARSSVAASDAFLPFKDGLEVLIAAGVSAVVEPGGSIRDEEVVEAARKAGLTLYFTGVRHFNH